MSGKKWDVIGSKRVVVLGGHPLFGRKHEVLSLSADARLARVELRAVVRVGLCDDGSEHCLPIRSYPDEGVFSYRKITRSWDGWCENREPLAVVPSGGVPADVRCVVLDRDQHLCRYCGASCIKRPTVDHIVPASIGGSNQERNLVTSCNPCNQYKADRTPRQAGMVLLPIGTTRQALNNMDLTADEILLLSSNDK